MICSFCIHHMALWLFLNFRGQCKHLFWTQSVFENHKPWCTNASYHTSDRNQWQRWSLLSHSFRVTPSSVQVISSLTYILLLQTYCTEEEFVWRQAPYLYKYSSIMKASTTTVIALRHIHIYGMIVLWSTQCHACQSSQAKQCHMTQLREAMKILLFCLYIWDLQ